MLRAILESLPRSPLPRPRGLAEQGTTVYIATRSDSHNRSFIEGLKARLDRLDVAVRFHITEELHAKGILGDGYYLGGSMNFTYNGITVNEEALT